MEHLAGMRAARASRHRIEDLVGHATLTCKVDAHMDTLVRLARFSRENLLLQHSSAGFA